MATKKFYISERVDRQSKINYYVAYGQITKQEAKFLEERICGTLRMFVYDTETDYQNVISKLRSEGKIVGEWYDEILRGMFDG